MSSFAHELDLHEAIAASARCMPIYLGPVGSLQYFADVRRAQNSIRDSVPHESSAAPAFNLDACMKMGDDFAA